MSDYGDIAKSYKNGKHSKESLKEFEKTWGHRFLLGICIAMLVIAVLLIVYCFIALAGIAKKYDPETTQVIVSIASAFYTTGIIGAILMIPPAIVGIIVSKHPRRVVFAYIFAGIALLLIILMVIYVIALHSFRPLTLILYAVLFLILPVSYLVAAIKIGKSNKL